MNECMNESDSPRKLNYIPEDVYFTIKLKSSRDEECRDEDHEVSATALTTYQTTFSLQLSMNNAKNRGVFSTQMSLIECPKTFTRR